jgi:hypothetical protein
MKELQVGDKIASIGYSSAFSDYFSDYFRVFEVVRTTPKKAKVKCLNDKAFRDREFLVARKPYFNSFSEKYCYRFQGDYTGGDGVFFDEEIENQLTEYRKLKKFKRQAFMVCEWSKNLDSYTEKNHVLYAKMAEVAQIVEEIRGNE